MKAVKGCALAGCATFLALLVALWLAWRAGDPLRKPLPPAPPLPVPNAFDDYKRAADLVYQYKAARKDEDPADNATVRRSVLGYNAEALKALRAGFAHDYGLPQAESLIAESPYFGHCSALAKVLGYEAIEHEANGRYAAAIDSQLDAVRLGVDLERGAPYLDRELARSAQASGRARKFVEARLAHLDAKAATAAARRLEKIVAGETLPIEALRVDRAVAPWVLRDMGRQADAESKDPAGAAGAERVLRLGGPFLFALYDARIDAMIAWTATGEHGAKPSTPSPYPKLAPAGDLVGGVISAEVDRQWIDHAANAMFLAAVALQAWHAQHGHWPDKLDALVPDILAAVPQDPFDGAPLRYRREGDKYVLYSVGPGQTDHGGTAAQQLYGGAPGQVFYEPGPAGDCVWGVTQM